MRNYKLILAYDGTEYFGWQKTPFGPSIEGTLEKGLFQILGETVELVAASRTDRGVHAHGQVVQFRTNKPFSVKSLNAVLPKDLFVTSMEEAEEIFHPTLDAKSKEYHYQICTGVAQIPSKRRFSWHVPYNLSWEKMEKEAQCLIGTHDFSAFANDNQWGMREITNIVVTPEKIRITGNRFLYKMVRNIVGSLVYFGCGKIASLETILHSRDRKQAAVCAPAKGLTLYRVAYD